MGVQKRQNHKTLKVFLQGEMGAALLLFVFSIIALLWANSPLSHSYSDFINIPLGIEGVVTKPLSLWVNDGLMSLFFLLVGLEIKREFKTGHLSHGISAIAMPAMAAVAGMVVPAIIYLGFNYNSGYSHGWAIPAATDIAFSLGVLALLGSRISSAARIFLLTIAIFDDLGAILVIALFYTSQLNFLFLLLAGGIVSILFVMNRMEVQSIWLYLIIGAVMWACILSSGLHATIAGVILAMFIPCASKGKGKSKRSSFSPMDQLEMKLTPVVDFLVLPLFALVNLNLDFTSILDGNTWSQLIFNPVTLGVTLGLFIGKPLGIFGVCFALKKLNLVKMPIGVSLRSVLPISCICGIGFTMSLFIGKLAFPGIGAVNHVDYYSTLGVVLGSLLSAIFGIMIAYAIGKPKSSKAKTSATKTGNL